MVLDMKDKALTLIILIAVLAILGCTSNSINGTQNNTTINDTSYFGNLSANLSIDASNYNDSAGLTAGVKLEAIRIALGSDVFRQNSQGCTNISVAGVLPSNVGGKPAWTDSGFLNSPDIAFVPIDTSGNIIGGIPYFGVRFAAYVDMKNKTVIGVDTYDIRAVYCYTQSDLPANSTWYHQLAGTTGQNKEYNTTHIALSVVTNENDTNSIYPLILDSANFEKFSNGSRYEVIQYTDYMTNQTNLIDGKSPLNPQYDINGSAAWYANVSISGHQPTEEAAFKPTRYYIVLENKANRTISVRLNMYMPFFIPVT